MEGGFLCWLSTETAVFDPKLLSFRALLYPFLHEALVARSVQLPKRFLEMSVGYGCWDLIKSAGHRVLRPTFN